MAEESNLLQSRASVARLAHNQEVVGSIPTSAPNLTHAYYHHPMVRMSLTENHMEYLTVDINSNV